MGKHNSGQHYVDIAEKNHLRVKNGRGDHVKIYASGERPMVVPMHRELATGTECSIRKWFLRLGILVCLALWLACVAIALYGNLVYAAP